MLADVSSIVQEYRNATRNRRFKPEAIAKGPAAAAVVKRAKARAAYGEIAGLMKELRAAGLTFKAIANALNAAGHTTRYGSQFDAANVFHVIRQYAA